MDNLGQIWRFQRFQRFVYANGLWEILPYCEKKKRRPEYLSDAFRRILQASPSRRIPHRCAPEARGLGELLPADYGIRQYAVLSS